MAVFLSREIVVPQIPVHVTITGSGDSTYSYVTIAGTKHTKATAGIKVKPGDTIVFLAAVRANYNIGTVAKITIDGTVVASAKGDTSGSTNRANYTWTVPKDVSSIVIDLSYTGGSSGDSYWFYGTVTATSS